MKALRFIVIALVLFAGAAVLAQPGFLALLIALVGAAADAAIHSRKEKVGS